VPEVTIYIHSNSGETHTKEAVESFLKQKGVDFDILIIDDGSHDNYLEIIKSFNDSRIKIIRNEKEMGRAYLNNLVIKRSSSPFIVFAESRYILLYDAIKRLLEMITSSDRIGLVHCFNFIVDENGKISREHFHKIFNKNQSKLRAYSKYKNEILYKGMEINGLRIYRKEVLKEVGFFDETIRYDEDYDLTLRIMDKFEIVLLPEFLYCVKKKKTFIIFDQLKKIINLRKKLFINKRLLINNSSSFLNPIEYNPKRVVLYGLYNILHLSEVSSILDKVFIKISSFINRKALVPLSNGAYKFIIKHCSWWPIELFDVKGRDTIISDKRIAYYIWQFPVLSQTFVQREIATLIRNGSSIEIFSEKFSESDFLSEFRETLEDRVKYLEGLDRKTISSYKRYFFFKNPLVYINSFLFTVFHNYHSFKTFKNDYKKFSKAILLAGFAKDNNVNHIHSPWADNCAFVSSIASKLLGVSYSLHARAHDIHRMTYLKGLPERFTDARFIITNTRYNVRHINSLLNNHSEQKIKLIYNGLNLEKFEPRNGKEKLKNPIKILSVARLIDQKGLSHLLKACKILKDKGYQFKCNIIGGTEDIFINNYLLLKKLHRDFELDDCVFFIGSKPFNFVLEAYKNADFFVLPCVIADDGSRDITPNSLIESMAMMLPVISTNITGIPEIVENGVSGILIPPNDEVKLSEAMIELIENQNLREILGINARKRIEERFDINKNVGQLIELFNRTN